MKEKIPQPAPLSRTLQGKTREANTASVTHVLQAYKKGISQRQEVDEDELLQGKFETVQRDELEDDELLQGKFETAQRQEAPNNTGLPDNLKAGVEHLSGLDMSDVKVHYNSSKPASVQAYAYTQGTDIHVASGQEKHLGHEAWHVAQQKQGRVQPTTTVGGMAVNDNAGLENEADVMGGKAVQMKPEANKTWAVANYVSQRKSNGEKIFGFVDNRTESAAQRKLNKIACNKCIQNATHDILEEGPHGILKEGTDKWGFIHLMAGHGAQIGNENFVRSKVGEALDWSISNDIRPSADERGGTTIDVPLCYVTKSNFEVYLKDLRVVLNKEKSVQTAMPIESESVMDDKVRFKSEKLTSIRKKLEENKNE